MSVFDDKNGSWNASDERLRSSSEGASTIVAAHLSRTTPAIQPREIPMTRTTRIIETTD
jgi:hypothetical protein